MDYQGYDLEMSSEFNLFFISTKSENIFPHA